MRWMDVEIALIYHALRVVNIQKRFYDMHLPEPLLLNT